MPPAPQQLEEEYFHDEPRLHQIAPPYTHRVRGQAKKPLDADAPYPARRRRRFTGDVIHQPADIENRARVESPAIFVDPALLPRHAHADEKQIRCEAVDRLYDGAVLRAFTLRVEIAVRRFQRKSREFRLQNRRAFFRDAGARPEIEDAPAPLLRVRQQRPNPIQMCEPLSAIDL